MYTPLDIDAPIWLLLPKGGRKEGPYSLAQLLDLRPSATGKVRRDSDAVWVAWNNVSAVYPELKVVHLPTMLDRTLLLPDRFMEILREASSRRRLLDEMRREVGTHLPLQNWIHEVAPRCQATPDQLRDVVQSLLRENDLEAMSSLLDHPNIPEDVLLQIASQGICLSTLGHRLGPKTLLDKLAEEHVRR